MTDVLEPERRGKARVVARARSGAALTAREIQMLAAIAQGATNLEIAQRWLVCEDTVKTALTVVYRKLGARNRAHAVGLAFAPYGFVFDHTGRLVAKPPPVAEEVTDLLVQAVSR